MEENKKQAENRGGMSRAKWMLALSLCLCLISMVFSSALQSGFGSVEVKELKLMDPSGYAAVSYTHLGAAPQRFPAASSSAWPLPARW